MTGSNAATATGRWQMVAALALATLGAGFHHTRAFPTTTPLVFEMAAIWLPALVLGVWWILRPGPTARWAIIVWALLNLGLGLWGRAYEEPATNDTLHLVYGLTQIPLLIVAYRSQPTRKMTIALVAVAVVAGVLLVITQLNGR